MASERRRGGRRADVVYLGGAGVIWALARARLHRLGRCCRRVRRPLPPEPDLASTQPPASYWGGECGIALVASRLTGDAGLVDRVHELVLENVASPTNEVMWGTPGIDARGRGDARVDGRGAVGGGVGARAERVHAARDDDGLWTQDSTARLPVPRSGARLRRQRPRARQPRQVPPLAELSPYLLREDGLANWTPETGRGRTRSACSGAMARRGWSRRSATCSTRSSRSPAAS